MKTNNFGMNIDLNHIESTFQKNILLMEMNRLQYNWKLLVLNLRIELHRLLFLFETIAIAIGNESSTLHFNLLALKCSKRKCVKIQSR